MEYAKPWLTLDQQADLLIERGMRTDRDDFIAHLADVSYYRLSGYWYVFKRRPEPGEDGGADERFVEGAIFADVWSLYTFEWQFPS